MLIIKDLYAGYGNIEVLKGINMEINEGELICLIGANGAGKTTLLRTVSGQVHPSAGAIHFKDSRIDDKDAENIVRTGISHVPEGRRVFPRSTVRENLEMGAYIRSDHKEIEKDIQRFFEWFPILKQRERHYSGLLSGGEQQMLAICRGLMSRPELLLLDEPSMGLAPLLVNQIFQIIKKLNQQGITILLVEQNAKKALEISERAYVLEVGCITLADKSSNLINNDEIRRAYLGGKEPQAQ